MYYLYSGNKCEKLHWWQCWTFCVQCLLGHDLPWMLFPLYSLVFKRFHWLQNPTQKKQRALSCVDDDWGGLLGHRGICVRGDFALPQTAGQGYLCGSAVCMITRTQGQCRGTEPFYKQPSRDTQAGHTALMYFMSYFFSLLFLLLSLKKTIQKWNARHSYITDSYEGPCYQQVTVTVIVCAVRSWIALSRPVSRIQPNPAGACGGRYLHTSHSNCLQ